MMKINLIFIGLSIVCLLVMTMMDFFLGAEAEYINAWSVFERLLGRPVSAGDSMVFRKIGGIGELIIVVIINVIIGGSLTLLFKWFSRR